MKCFVCNQEYQGAVCPRCTFPNVQVPGATREKAMQDLAPTIAVYKNNFLSTIRLDVVICYWKDEQGLTVLDHEDTICLGTGTELYQKEMWHEQKFARIENEPRIFVTLRITMGDKTREQQVALENISDPYLQQLGVEMDGEFNICLKLRNDAGTETYSAWLPL